MGPRRLAVVVAVFLITAATGRTAELPAPVVFASYNVRNWLSMDRTVGGRNSPSQPKPDDEKRAVINVLTGIRPDVLGVMEIGQRSDLDDLADRLKASGLDYPHREWVQGDDQERHVALLSRFPISARNSRTDIRFTLNGRPHAMNRGILDVTVEPLPGYQLRLVGVHLKSKRKVPEADETAVRAKEAWSLRQHVNAILAESPRANLLLFGDFNDTRNEYPIREILGQGTGTVRLKDLRLADPQGDKWTQNWQAADIYSRFDYLIASPGLLPEILDEESGIDRSPEWATASDHRAIFTAITPVDQ